jgi:hypothetical protein
MLVIEPKDGRELTRWSDINWTAVEANVRRLQGRLYRAAVAGVGTTACNGGICAWKGISSPDSKSGAGPAESSSVGAGKTRLARQANGINPNKPKKSFVVKL